MKVFSVRLRAKDNDIFDAIKTGKKKIETRAFSPKFQKMRKGDILRFICGKASVLKTITDIHVFKGVGSLVKKYRVKDINPMCKTKKDLEKMYWRFPGYKEKIKKYGIVAWRIK